MPRTRRLGLGLIALFSVMIALFGTNTAATAHGNRDNTNHRGCERVTERVTLAPNTTQTYKLAGWLCGDRKARTVQLLNSGFTYGNYYWDLPYRNSYYSYVRTAGDAGFAVLNIDRIGVGDSDKPAADKVDVYAHAWINAQLSERLRKGHVGHRHNRFKHVVGVGHSLGAIIMKVTQVRYRSFDAIVSNGMMHTADTAYLASLAPTRHDAAADPKFKDAGLPTGYITSKPGTRVGYYAANPTFYDQKVLDKDEDLKQTATTGELTTLALGRDTSFAPQVTVPNLIWTGDIDRLHCNDAIPSLSCSSLTALTAREKPVWSKTRCLGLYIQRNAGHDTSLHYSAPSGVRATSWWLMELGFARKNYKFRPAQQDYLRCA